MDRYSIALGKEPPEVVKTAQVEVEKHRKKSRNRAMGLTRECPLRK